MRSKNAKPLIALALTGAGSALVIAFQVPEASTLGGSLGANTAAALAATPSATAAAPTVTATTRAAATTNRSKATDAPVPTSTPAPTETAANSSLYADGTYTGDAEQEPWGTFQVEVIVSHGQVTDVSVVSAPSDGHSNRINRVAVPLLTQSVLAA